MNLETAARIYDSLVVITLIFYVNMPLGYFSTAISELACCAQQSVIFKLYAENLKTEGQAS